MATILPDGRVLVGRTVRLDPLSLDDADGLFPLFADPGIYSQGFVMQPPPADLAEMRELLRVKYLPPVRAAYAVRVDGELAGTSSLFDADLTNERVHLGCTLYGRRWWGTAVNPETKLLLLQHAFDDCGFGRVKIQTDLLNTRAQAAIARLGATREGVLRRHMRRADGSFRDTVVYSVIRDDWPVVRERLAARLR